MYQYDQYDQNMVDERVNQYRHQTQRYLDGTLSEEQFLPLRLQNGLYIQRNAPMLRIAIPYGMLRADQLRMLADISDQYDRGYGHISTRQNMQLNWVALEQVPDILEKLASVQMHAIQTSGNCIRNVTTDQFAGVAFDEVADPRPWCEVLRQWSTFHPEFAFLPRKFKIAINANTDKDRAAIKFHDIGLQIVKDAQQNIGFEVWVGGGLGRTPIIAEKIENFVHWQDILGYLESVLRVYNLNGRRDNKYKARIKIMVKALGIDAFRALVHKDWDSRDQQQLKLTQHEVDRIHNCFTSPKYQISTTTLDSLTDITAINPGFRNWINQNITRHRTPGYAAVTLALKATGEAPGDITSAQMKLIANLADQYSFGELRTTHEQNMVLSDVRIEDLHSLWQALAESNLATPNIGTLNDMICCPGGDFCALANAKSIPIAKAIQEQFDDLDYLYDLGDIQLNISGCMNACGHHHIGDIGILGVDKKGEEFYQVSIGGHSQYKGASIGKILGPSFKSDQVARVISEIIDLYVANRTPEESFADVVIRLGHQPFKEKVYAKKAA